MVTTYTRELERLTHSGLELAEPAMDLRDREVRDRSGNPVGTVSDVLIDPDQRRVRMIQLTTGGTLLGLGRRHYLVPIEAVGGGDPRTVYIDRDQDEILSVDEYRPAEGDAEEDQYAAAYAAYGVTPYWVSDSGARMAGG